VTIDPEATAVPLGTTTLLEGWMHRIPGNVAHASILGMDSSCLTEQARKVIPQISADTLAEDDIHWIAAGGGILTSRPRPRRW
jgi:hypothetical protein